VSEREVDLSGRGDRDGRSAYDLSYNICSQEEENWGKKRRSGAHAGLALRVLPVLYITTIERTRGCRDSCDVLILSSGIVMMDSRVRWRLNPGKMRCEGTRKRA